MASNPFGTIVGGALFSKDAPLDDRLRFELVEVSTIDHFVKRIVERRKQADVSWWLEGKNGFDLIKIDAEGQDREVIFGGLDQIKNHAKIFSFECAPCPIKKTDFEMFEDWGFSCYSLTRAGRQCFYLISAAPSDSFRHIQVW